MNLLEAFETYTTAQKTVGLHFILIGVCLFLIAIGSHFLLSNELGNGLKIGALITGLMILAGGIGYRSFSENLFQKNANIHQQDPVQFKKVEVVRMEKVAQDYSRYQMVFGGFIIAALLVIFLVGKPFWTGVSYTVIILFIGVLISEYWSKFSIYAYLQAVS